MERKNPVVAQVECYTNYWRREKSTWSENEAPWTDTECFGSKSTLIGYWSRAEKMRGDLLCSNLLGPPHVGDSTRRKLESECSSLSSFRNSYQQSRREECAREAFKICFFKNLPLSVTLTRSYMSRRQIFWNSDRFFVIRKVKKVKHNPGGAPTKKKTNKSNTDHRVCKSFPLCVAIFSSLSKECQHES